ncbi:MAG: hypothetical protein EOO14_00830 [Chitinophagaceae bacterium]|nr:MAG: hypothetical protein EOO14_00830 [Chitinophagaceae bacterium]
MQNEDLRHHLTNLESVFSMLGEAYATAIVKTKKPKGIIENKNAAKQGGAVAGNARKELETKTGQKVVTKQNYLSESATIKNKKIAASPAKKKSK